MKWIPYSLTFLICIFLTNGLIAQQKFSHNAVQLVPGPDGIVRCASMEVDFVKRLNNPNLQSIEDFEKWLAPKIVEYKKQAANKSTPSIITIPFVVHVLHNGEPVGSAPNITDAQVLSQVQVLNEDFRKILGSRGWNDHPAGADVEIEFCPAATDPYGNPTNGINRVNIQQDGANRDDLEGAIKPSTIWDPTKYMNMWSVKFADPDDNLLGYAQFPEGSGLPGMPVSGEDPSTDGVVIRYEAFGTIDEDDGSFILMNNYNLGRTATHEVGHWVGLRHIWGDGLGCNLPAVPPGCSCLQDDYCEDTPNQEGARYDCDLPYSSACNVPPVPDMKENYMDYTNDVCMNIFTNDQKARVQAVMLNSPRRKELVNSPACAPPSPYIAFAGTNTVLEEGSSCDVQTIDLEVVITTPPSADATVHFSVSGTASQGAGNDFTLSSTSLTFPSGSTASQFITVSIQEDAEVEPGEVIILQIDSVSTTGNTLKSLTNVRHIITILDDDFAPEQAGSTPQILLFTEDFNTLGLDWTVVNAGGSAVTWKVGTPPLGLLGNYHAFISPTALPLPVYLYNPNAFGYSSIESPSINASTATNLELSFTYTCFGEEGYDFGTLWYQKNGGPWVQFGGEISSQPIETSLTVPLPEGANNAANLRLAFRWENDELLGGHPPFSFDNVELRATAGSPATVQTGLSDENENYMGPYATVHFYDPLSGKIMATIKNNSNYDFGCSTLEVDRSINSAGTNAVQFWNSNPSNKLAAKTFLLTTANKNPPAGVSLSTTLFYTNAELSAWESATQQSRHDLETVWVEDNAIATVTPSNGSNYEINKAASTLINYTNANYKLKATIPAKAGGFGIGIAGNPEAVQLGNQPNIGWNGIRTSEIPDLAVFPNPAKDQLTLALKDQTASSMNVIMRNQFGQTIMNSQSTGTDRLTLDITDIPPGVYFFTIKMGEYQTTEKVVVQKD